MATYDFIVVGSGPGGATLASRVAKSAAAPNILLLEAGGSTDAESRILAERYITKDVPSTNWGYQTAPQESLNGRVLDLSRGKALGGSSAINYACWTIGPKDDYDYWAELVGDDSFGWEHAQRRYKAIETYEVDLPSQFQPVVKPKGEDHGLSGPVHVQYSGRLDPKVTTAIELAESIGFKRLDDVNTGEVRGVGVIPATAHDGKRETAATAFLENPPSNLSIVTNTFVTKLLFDGKKVIGVEAGDKKYFASKEVILSCGAVDTPKLLQLSGIGPAAELASHGIECILDLPGVGKNFQDHYASFVIAEQKEYTADDVLVLRGDKDAYEAARKQHLLDGTGPLAAMYNVVVMGWKNDTALFDTPEFKSLPVETQKFLRQPNVPAWEYAAGFPTPGLDPTKSYLMLCAINMAPQSTGTVKLASSNPEDAPICDQNLMSHPYDRRSFIHAMKDLVKILETPAVKDQISAVILAPKSTSDDDILEHIKNFGQTSWHPSSTVKMGKPNDPMACVDSNFRVLGLENLRVSDLSCAPFVPNCHPMSHTYNIGAHCAEKIIAHFGLDG